MSAQFNGGLIGDAKKLTGAVWAIRRCGCVEGDSLEELFVYFDSEWADWKWTRDVATVRSYATRGRRLRICTSRITDADGVGRRQLLVSQRRTR